MKTLLTAAIASFGLAVALSSSAWAQDTGEFVSFEGTADRNILLAGGNVRVEADIAEDVVVAGGEITIRGQITKDILAAGGDILVDATVGEDVRVAGGDIVVRGTIGGDVLAAGGDVRLARDLTIAGRLDAAAGNLDIDADVAGDARVAGGRVNLGGSFGGDVDATGETIRVLGGAHIAGDFVYRSLNEAEIDPNARIDGDVTFIRSDATDEFLGGAFAGVGAGSLLFLIGLIVLGGVVILWFPGAVRDVTRDMRARPGRALAVGAAVFIGTPLLAILLAISFIGFPVTIFLVGLFLAGLFAAYLAVALTLGQLILRRFRGEDSVGFWGRVGALALGILILAVAGFIPILGPIVTIVALMLGFGAMTLQVVGSRPASAI